ncbi:helix-turn-helix domain-containing protein [Halobacterium sp. KA-6]|uniref:helix-turn-helix domain-containing protein n=1 Tax=Halobacterium sp. KA-6 TaxID=2896368 RepID=UPI001E3E8F7E|nr:helix-turn-helix domain-containing protein [Halobacterium sp. KA-6]MCD2202682.1 helix-turn-helix domain-containing protein [Halobacterium sp. KA-6]
MSENLFPVKPDTNEYQALSFLIVRRKQRFTPRMIAEHTDICESNVSETVERLFENDLVERSEGAYYVDPRADKLKQRLESLDAVVQLFDSVPTDDAYGEEGWEDEVPSIETND